MSTVVMLLPLLLMPLLYAVLIKSAAFVLRRMKVSWKDALLFALLAMLVGGVIAFANLATGQIVPVALAFLTGVAIQLTLGGWYFRCRARLATGVHAGPARGALMVFVAVIFVIMLAAVVSFVFPPGLQHDGRP